MSPVEGPCDDTCGCASKIASPSEATGCGCGSSTCATPVASVAMGATISGAPSCSLASGQLAERMARWRRHLTSATRRDEIHGGVRFAFDSSSALAELAALVAAEQGCCSFFSFVLAIDSAGITLEVTAPAEGASMLTEVFEAVS